MTDTQIVLYILLVDDDPETLCQLMELLPTEIAGYKIHWEPCGGFDEAVISLAVRRYDLVATDIYRDRQDKTKGIDKEDEKALDIIQAIRGKQFCPIVAFTDGSSPESFASSPFVKFANKVKFEDIIAKVEELIETGLPIVARRIHNQLSELTGSYLWDFLEENWKQLSQDRILEQSVLERLIRRRASIQISRLQSTADGYREIESIEGLEFYIYPSISGNEFRLGEILRLKSEYRSEESGGSFQTQFRVVLTPHCHLTIQPGDTDPRATFVLTAKAIDARKFVTDEKRNAIQKAKDEKEKHNLARRIIQSPADLGKPAGRYWFLPGFLSIPDLYCDFLQLESLQLKELKDKYERVAVLDTPFGEALQSCFLRFYSAIGLPNLSPGQFQHLISVPTQSVASISAETLLIDNNQPQGNDELRDVQLTPSKTETDTADNGAVQP